MSSLKKIRQFSLDVWKEFKDSQLLTVASSLAYTTVLSIIPLLAVSLAIFQKFGGLERLYLTLEPFLFSHLTQGAGETATTYIRKFITNIHAGTLGATGFLALLITSMSLLFSIDKAINRIWRTTDARTWFQRVSTYWLFITLGPLALAVALGFVTSHEYPIAKILPGKSGIALLSTSVFFLIFKYIPNRFVHWRPALITSSITAILWSLAAIGYGFYTKRLVSYDKIYGSLSAVPILLLWIYLTWLIILSGVVATSVLQRKYDFK